MSSLSFKEINNPKISMQDFEPILGLVGYPLRHSLSPLLHAFAIAGLNKRGAYMAWPVPPEGLPEFVRLVRDMPVAGVSVTMPHKEKIIGLLDQLSPRAEKAGAVNTLSWKEDLLVGHNTDVEGFAAPLRKYFVGEKSGKIKKALLLGSGGAAKAALCALLELGLSDIAISSCDAESARNMARLFQIEAVPWENRSAEACDLLVNATPLGMKGLLAGQSPWPEKIFKQIRLVYDLIYNPEQTKLIVEAQKAGLKTISGLEMFLHQAQAQFRLWTGYDFDLNRAAKLLKTFLAHSD